MTLSFSKLGNHGRLGNQLFQIAATKGLAERFGGTASFPAWQYEQYFEDALPRGAIAPHVLKEPKFEYTEHTISKDTDLLGYFQSPKYFPANYKPKLKADFLARMNGKLPAGEKICVQIRRGDYVNHEAYYQLPVTWFIKALMTIEGWQEKQIIFISDDLGYCKVHFECLPNAHFIPGSDIEQMAMGSLCDHHIISNSSYGWWTAYLSEQKNVIYPSKYFRGSYSYKTTSDLWPENWTSFMPEDCRLDCTDLTITIPVMHDHSDRKRNLELSLCHLQKYINAQYIIGECVTESFAYTGQWAKYIRYPYREFHRTKMLNQMAEAAETPLIANWDCDIFIPPLQIWLACELLRKDMQMVYPYDGRFARMDREQWFKRVESTVDIGMVGNNRLSDRQNVRESVGGAVLWTKEAFIEYGMENEYMISYAPEDVERYERAQKLGCRIKKQPGTLYHMDHFKGVDSCSKNPHFKKSREILETYRLMSKDQLWEEVNKWPWRHKYTPSYYARISEGAITSAQITYTHIAKETGLFYQNSSVIDVGCGIGEWACGNPHYVGVDYGVNKKNLLIAESQYTDHDLNNSDALYRDRSFDLCICLEVAEHLPESSADQLINLLCDLSDYVLFSAAIPNQGGTGHINEQWQTYWAEKFYANGFGAEICYPVKDNPNVELWYRQNMILYKRGATGKVYNFVLTDYYEQIVQHWKRSAEAANLELNKTMMYAQR